MDPFTQRMLERAKLRREKLENHLTNSHESPPITSKEKLCIINKNNSGTEFDLKGKNDKQGITDLGKIKLQKLAQLYSEENGNQILTIEKPEEEFKNLPKKIQFKSNKLAALTEKISQWEDENNRSKQLASTARKGTKNLTSERVKRSGERKNHLIWNPPMMEELCSQGFSLSEKQSRLIYDFEEAKEVSTQLDSKSNNLLSKTEVSHKSSCFQQENIQSKTCDRFYQNSKNNKFAPLKCNSTTESKILEKDPAELSLAERKALFERNLNEDLKLKQNFKNFKPSSYLKPEKTAKLSTFDTSSKEKEKNAVKDKNELSPPEKEKLNLKKISRSSDGQNFSFDASPACVRNEDIQKEDRKESLNDNQPNLPESSMIHSVANIEEGNIEPTMDLDCSNNENRRLYPNLDNLETDDYRVNFEVLESEALNESKNNVFLLENNSENLSVPANNSPELPVNCSFSKSQEFQVLNRIDVLLENALNNISANNENMLELSSPSPSKISKSSNCEFNASNKSSPLLHTISFYRKQQQISSTSHDELKENEEEPLKFREDQGALVENKIQFLVAEVNKQQTIMSQASQALNLCLSTVEFSGSGEQVEGERLLLLASHKRQACLNEIQRLKIEKCVQSFEENNFEKGDVTLSNITIKLKRDALRAMAVAESLQYFVCLIKSEERVLATPVVPATRENLKDLNLQFPGILKLEGLLSDFKVSVEVYNLELNKEILPHDIKYHIVNKKDKKLLTPIKSKKPESKLVKPKIQSPAGPNAVRTSNFQMCGYIVFSLREISRTQWTLNKVPYMSSLEGSISMNIHSQLRLDDEHRGFLTMFEDISGFGAWHRRWCLLSSHIISFWKYPDDEQKKIPIGSIDLRSVTTENVGLVSRDICARLHTFLLETRRPRMHEDRNSLVLSVEDNVTIIRQLLSADSKKDMMIWCKKINATLALLRSWKCNIE